jgi:hypothetical protein
MTSPSDDVFPCLRFDFASTRIRHVYWKTVMNEDRTGSESTYLLYKDLGNGMWNTFELQGRHAFAIQCNLEDLNRRVSDTGSSVTTCMRIPHMSGLSVKRILTELALI